MAAEKIYTLDTLAEYLGVKISTVYKLTSSNAIAYFTIGSAKGIRFTQAMVDDYIKSRTKPSQRDINRQAVTYCLNKPLQR